MKDWYYLEHKIYPGPIYADWTEWLLDNVGFNELDWKWDDFDGAYFICFKKEEDATAFKLTFKL